MRTLSFLNPSRPTENKIRWTVNVGGAPFHLYIPKRRVPQKIPMGLEVVVDEVIPRRIQQPITPNNDYPIKAIVVLVRKHTKTVRYRPIGDDPKKWEIGEPYIPKDLLPDPYPKTLYIEVRWDYTEGVWQLNQ